MWNFWEQYEDVSKLIQKALVRMQDFLYPGAGESVKTVLDHIFENEGKVLRCGLTILSGRRFCAPLEKLIDTAAAIEMLHLASLIHDDIIDDSKYRRGKLSVQGRFGKDVAVYAGDYCLARAFLFMSKYPGEDMSDFTGHIENICQGEILQNQNRFNTGISEEDYFKIIEGKTATLFYLSVKAGARLGSSEDDENRGRVCEAARLAGLAFQLMDDCRDFDGTREVLKKEPGTDIQNGIYTLPVIRLLKGDKDFPKIIESQNLDSILGYVVNSGVLEDIRREAGELRNQAIERLSSLNPDENTDIMKALYTKITQ